MSLYPLKGFFRIKEALLQSQEIAIIDVREEALFAEGHPLFATNIPLSRLELEVLTRVPSFSTPVVVYDNGEGLAEQAYQKLSIWGYSDVALLEGGLKGWEAAGGEIFHDVNSPSKAFGELVESVRHTPSLTAEEVKVLLDSNADVVVLDARRFDEYQTMSIPTSISVPGAELALRIKELAPNLSTQVIVNCAGRTRSLIGTQSLINAGIPNQVAALRNGTIGWVLAGQTLEYCQSRCFQPVSDETRLAAAASARALADQTLVRRATLEQLSALQQEPARTTYLFDVRTPDEFTAGHFPDAFSAPGGQLVQETDHHAAVRGARVVLVDDDGVRANMTASWLAQMGWEVYVLEGVEPSHFTESGNEKSRYPPVQSADVVTAESLAILLGESGVTIFDLTTYQRYQKGHIPSAKWVLRTDVVSQVKALPQPQVIVLTCGSDRLARFARQELAQQVPYKVVVLEGGNAAWRRVGLPEETGSGEALSPLIDRYRRPYEGTDNPEEAMRAYLDWEFGLVAQLEKDGTHGFQVI
ncbi:MAG: rhodanese homology domain-containing protein [Halomonas sp.]|uniref:rhodanese homology domain-containing protein n=1 Tax=Halomonas sp. TaxID=1486246 RepID=UPI003F8EBDCE